MKIKLQNLINETINSSKFLNLTSFIGELEKQGVNTKIKVSAVGEIQGISYELESCHFAASKLGRNNSACTIPALKSHGIKIDLKQIRTMIDRSDINFSPRMARKIMNHHNNKSIFFDREKTIQKTQYDRL